MHLDVKSVHISFYQSQCWVLMIQWCQKTATPLQSTKYKQRLVGLGLGDKTFGTRTYNVPVDLWRRRRCCVKQRT